MTFNEELQGEISGCLQRTYIYVLYIPLIGLFNFLYIRTGPKCEKMAKTDLQEATSDLGIEGQGHKTIAFVALPIYTHIPNLKSLTKILFKLSRPKGNLGGPTFVWRYKNCKQFKLVTHLRFFCQAKKTICCHVRIICKHLPKSK